MATAVAEGGAYSWDATPLVRGSGLVTLVRESPNGDGARYFSRGGAGSTPARAPPLTVTCS